MNEFIAYHGTNSEHVQSIFSKGFNLSASHNEWLGDGVYFFIGDTFCPISNAREWAINSSWDKSQNNYTYQRYSILKTKVYGNRVLDLRKDEDLAIFNTVRGHIMKRYEEEKREFRRKMAPDTFLCNAVAKSLKLDILIHNFYIKNKLQRLKRIDSRIPNSTVLCAKDTAIIDLANMEEIETRGIKNG